MSNSLPKVEELGTEMALWPQHLTLAPRTQ